MCFSFRLTLFSIFLIRSWRYFESDSTQKRFSFFCRTLDDNLSCPGERERKRIVDDSVEFEWGMSDKHSRNLLSSMRRVSNKTCENLDEYERVYLPQAWDAAVRIFLKIPTFNVLTVQTALSHCSRHPIQPLRCSPFATLAEWKILLFFNFILDFHARLTRRERVRNEICCRRKKS